MNQPIDHSELGQLGAGNLDELADKYDVDCPEPAGPEPTRTIREPDVEDVTRNASDDEAEALIRCAARQSEQAPGELGQPGARVDQTGRVRTAVAKYGPWTVRGHHGDDGLYEKYYRTEPQIFQAVNAVTGILVNGTHVVEPPEEIQQSQESAVKDFVAWCNGWLHGIQHSSPGGLSAFVEHAASAQIFGFALHEVVWDTDDEGRWRPEKYAFREQNTIDQWIMDDRQAELIAVQQDGLGIDGATIPASGAQPTDRKVLLSNLHARGNNFEGISMIRPAIHWIKVKRILGQILPVAADKHGAPVTKIMEDPEYMEQAIADGGADSDDKEDVYKIYEHLRAVEGAVIQVPAGIKVGVEGPQGKMPTFGDMFDYCDQMIATPWNNQGSLLGQGSVGSYATAKVEDSKFVRSVPSIHQSIFRPVNDQIRYLAQKYLESRPDVGQLPAYPTVSLRLDHMTDTSAWIEDATKAMGGQPMTAWPEGLQEAALEKLDLPKDTFADGGDAEMPGTQPEGAT